MTRQPVREGSDLLLELLAAHELSPSQEKSLRSRLGDDEVERRLRALKDSDEDILARHPPARVVSALRSREGREEAPARGRLPLRWAAAVPVLAAFVGVLIWTGERPNVVDVAPDPELEVKREKGLQPRVLVYRMVEMTR